MYHIQMDIGLPTPINLLRNDRICVGLKNKFNNQYLFFWKKEEVTRGKKIGENATRRERG